MLQYVPGFSLVLNDSNRILRLEKSKGFRTTFLFFIIFT